MEGIAVYIIIAIIYFARYLLKNKNEKKQVPKHPNQPNAPQQPQQKKPQRKEPESLEDLLGELFGDKAKKTAPIPQPLVEVVEVDPFEEEKLRKAEKVRKRKERAQAEHLRRAKEQEEEVKRRALLMEKLARESHQDAKKKVLKPSKIAKSFNLKEAVIAKIILDRPYK